MKIRLTPREADILLTLFPDEATIQRTPELDELLGGKIRTFEGTMRDGVLTLGEEVRDQPVA